jgi:hypothetical protein
VELEKLDSGRVYKKKMVRRRVGKVHQPVGDSPTKTKRLQPCSWEVVAELSYSDEPAHLQCQTRRTLVLLFLPDVLYMVIWPSFRGLSSAVFRNLGTAVLARHALVSAFHLHRSVAKDSVCRRDFPVRQPKLDQGV